MRRALASVVVTVVLIAGCGGGSDSGGSDSSSGASAGDTQYIDPFQKGGNACLSKREVQRKIVSIASRVQTPEHKQRAIQAVKKRTC
jgi:hypothetical protein